MTECTTNDCANLTDLYLCNRCVEDLQAWIDKVPDLIDQVFITMAKLDNTAPAGNGGGGTVEAPLPLRPGAMEIRHELAWWENWYARELATHENAATYLPALKTLIDKAEKTIDLPDEQFTHGTCGAELDNGETCTATLTAPPETVWANCPECEAPHNLTERRKERLAKAVNCDPMPPAEVIQWLKEKAGIRIKKFDLENWVKHRHLRYVLARVTTGTKPPRVYFPDDLFRTYDTMMKKRHVA